MLQIPEAGCQVQEQKWQAPQIGQAGGSELLDAGKMETCQRQPMKTLQPTLGQLHVSISHRAAQIEAGQLQALKLAEASICDQAAPTQGQVAQ